MAENKADNKVIDLEEIKKDELKEIAKEKGLTFAEKITKSELIELIKANDDEIVEEEKEETDETEEKKETSDEEKENIDDETNEETDDEDKQDDENIDRVSLDNQPVSPLISNDDEVVPKNFVPVQRTTKPKQAKLNVHNGRVYKVLSNGRGMWADNGETFSLASLNNK